MCILEANPELNIYVQLSLPVFIIQYEISNLQNHLDLFVSMLFVTKFCIITIMYNL